MRAVIMVACLALLGGCTDAYVAKMSGYGDHARVTCYSGDRMIFDGCSTGKVASESQSDGYYFNEKTTSKLMEVSGNCVIVMKGACPAEPLLGP